MSLLRKVVHVGASTLVGAVAGKACYTVTEDKTLSNCVGVVSGAGTFAGLTAAHQVTLNKRVGEMIRERASVLINAKSVDEAKRLVKGVKADFPLAYASSVLCKAWGYTADLGMDDLAKFYFQEYLSSVDAMGVNADSAAKDAMKWKERLQ